MYLLSEVGLTIAVNAAAVPVQNAVFTPFNPKNSDIFTIEMYYFF
jgi:hypothetical protein